MDVEKSERRVRERTYVTVPTPDAADAIAVLEALCADLRADPGFLTFSLHLDYEPQNTVLTVTGLRLRTMPQDTIFPTGTTLTDDLEDLG